MYGIIRRSCVNTTEKIRGILENPNFHLIEGDVTDPTGIMRIVDSIQPNEIYHLAAQSHVGTSFEQPLASMQITGCSTISLLEAIRLCNPKCKFYQASTSELYGKNTAWPQNEDTDFDPVSPYAIAKLAAFHFVKLYRSAYGIFACNGILFNHESPRRGENFVSRKITKYVAKLAIYKERFGVFPDPLNFDKLHLGNIEAVRDWSHAEDMVYGMYLMLQQDKPGDYVLGSGQQRTVRDFLVFAFNSVGISKYEDYLEIDQKEMRPMEVPVLVANHSKAIRDLGWKPMISFDNMVKEMIRNDIEILRNKSCQD